MINLGFSLLLAAIVSVGMIAGLGVHAAISIPFGLICGFVLFFWLGRKMQDVMQTLQAQMQKDLQAQKLDRAIETLKQGYVYKNRHIFIASQLNSQIGQLYYLKKDLDKAMEYLKKGFFKDHIGHCMIGAIHFKRKEYDAMKQAMDHAIAANKKESIIYGLYAWLLIQIKEKDKAMEILQKGLEKIPADERLQTNQALLQNNKKMKMKGYGDLWIQFMLERPPRMVQEQPSYMGKVNRKQMFRGR